MPRPGATSTSTRCSSASAPSRWSSRPAPGVLVYLAVLLLVPSDDKPARSPRGSSNRPLVIVGVVVLLLVACPFFSSADSPRGDRDSVAVLVGAGVLVWWLVSGEGPSGDAARHRQARRARHRQLIPCFVLALRGASAPPPAPLARSRPGRPRGRRDRHRRVPEALRWLVLPALTIALAAGTVAAAASTWTAAWPTRVPARDAGRPARPLRARHRRLVVDLREAGCRRATCRSTSTSASARRW